MLTLILAFIDGVIIGICVVIAESKNEYKLLKVLPN
jgi:hypothetical protein